MLWEPICLCTWYVHPPLLLLRCCSGKLKTNPLSGHKWCLRDLSHSVPPGSREKSASSKGHFSCPLWQVVRLMQINCCNYCSLQVPDLLNLYPSSSQVWGTLWCLLYALTLRGDPHRGGGGDFFEEPHLYCSPTSSQGPPSCPATPCSAAPESHSLGQ